MDALKIQKPTQLRDQVYARVKRALLEGFYEQGERVTEDNVAKHLGVSRTPVREALRLLEELGFLESRAAGGYCVPTLSEEGISDLIDVRSLLESRTMQLAVKNGSQEQIDSLQAALKEAKKAAREHDTIDFYLALEPFWKCFWEMSHSPGLNGCLTKLTDQYHYQYLSAIALANEGVEAQLLVYLEELCDCLAKRDAKTGVKVVKSHLKFKKKALLDALHALE